MIDLSAIQASVSGDLDAVSGIVESMYNTNFAPYFKESRDVFNRLNSKVNPISDDELSYILIDLPVKLIDISEQVGAFRIKCETLKLLAKRKESELSSELKESGMKSADIKETVTLNLMEDKLLISAYSTVISRVESEIAFCKELIMGAKKIWDARRKSESANPVSEVESKDDLPDYQFGGKSYIKG